MKPKQTKHCTNHRQWGELGQREEGKVGALHTKQGKLLRLDGGRSASSRLGREFPVFHVPLARGS